VGARIAVLTGEDSMRRISTSFVTTALILGTTYALTAQQNTALSQIPKTISLAQLKNTENLDGQLVQLNGVVVLHTDTAQVFTFGDKQGPEMHVVIPKPAIDSANVGDTVAVVGTVRKYGAKEFERDYSWFRQADYPHLANGKWVIVARSVRTPEGTELVPGGTTSETPGK
jgi:hypothetical protein